MIMVGFIVTAAVGFVLLLVFLLFDGIFDAIHIDLTGSGVVSGASLGGLLTGFGCGGIIGTSQGWGLFPALLLGLLVGVGIAAVAVALYRILNRGLVQVSYLGSPRTVSFASDVSIRTGDSVIVTEVIGPDVVNVIPNQPGVGRNLE